MVIFVKKVEAKLTRIVHGLRGIPHFKGYPYVQKNGLKIIHISAFSHSNTGDLYLPVILRNLFNQTIPVKKWINRHVFKVVTDKDVAYFNKSDLIVIGGGGLFLTDTNPNNLSGWQWSCSVEHLNRIDVPIVAFAVGYNRFRGQEEFKPVFTEHLNRFVEKAIFVGIRNHGSIEKLKPYLKDEALREKLVFQPCMTTLTSLIYPSLCDYNKKEDFIAINCAFDRQSLRNNDEGILRKIASVALKLSRLTKIKYYSHVTNDENILPYFDEVQLEYQVVRLGDIRKTVVDYAKPRLVIGMRGHAQMIPFGCNTPILSIISHDKLQWFLDDIHHSDWGVDVVDPNFEENLYEKALRLYSVTNDLVEVLKKEQKRLYDITECNMNRIYSLMHNGK